MRIVRLPLWSPTANALEYSPASDVSVTEWDQKFANLQPENAENRAYQNEAFSIGLEEIGFEELHQRLFAAFPKSSWWIVTLGSGGMLALSRDRMDQSVWIPAPVVNVRNALGCGDVSRAGFLGWFMRSGLSRTEFLSSPASIVAATKFAVAAGSRKAEYFTLESAVQHLTWHYLSNEAAKLTAYPLCDKETIAKIQRNLSSSNDA
jgi:hypothetical protein